MITAPQLRRLFFLLKATALIHQKPDLVYSFSKNRTQSSRGLTCREADGLIKYLEAQLPVQYDPANQMRRKIISNFHRMQWEKSDGKIDMERINEWCRHKSYFKKNLQEYTYEQLPKLVAQVNFLYKCFIEQIN